MATPPSLSPRLQFGRALRERFLAEADKAMVEISGAVQTRLTELVDEPSSARESQIRRDVWTAYKKARPVWVDTTMKQWRECLDPPKAKKSANTLESVKLELVGTEVVENKILASRLVLAVNEKVISELDDLRVRIKYLEGTEDLDGRDVFRPEVLVLLLVEQWAQSGLPSDAWPMVNDVVQRGLIERLRAAYKNANNTQHQRTRVSREPRGHAFEPLVQGIRRGRWIGGGHICLEWQETQYRALSPLVRY